jgi:hypothetical protein
LTAGLGRATVHRMSDHLPGCPLRGMAWLDRAAVDDGAAFAGRTAVRRVAEGTRGADEAGWWADAGLSAALRRAAPAQDDLRLAWCTCGGGSAEA